jgi:hypothetical protein
VATAAEAEKRHSGQREEGGKRKDPWRPWRRLASGFDRARATHGRRRGGGGGSRLVQARPRRSCRAGGSDPRTCRARPGRRPFDRAAYRPRLARHRRPRRAMHSDGSRRRTCSARPGRSGCATRSDAGPTRRRGTRLRLHGRRRLHRGDGRRRRRHDRGLGSGRVGNRSRLRTGRQQRQRVDVALRIVRMPDAEVDIRAVVLHVSGRSDRADGFALRHAVALDKTDRAQMQQRHGEAVGRPHGDRPSVPGKPAGERHLARRRGSDGRSRCRPEVDAGMAVLVVLGAAELEASKNRSVDRPRPRACRRRYRERDHEHEGEESCCLFRQHRRSEGSRTDGCCQSWLQ